MTNKLLQCNAERVKHVTRINLCFIPFVLSSFYQYQKTRCLFSHGKNCLLIFYVRMYRCPVYTNVPTTCTRSAASGTECCETITCPAGTNLLTSTKNVLSLASGNYIMQPNPQSPTGELQPVVPEFPPGVSVGSGTQIGGYQAPTISEFLL